MVQGAAVDVQIALNPAAESVLFYAAMALPKVRLLAPTRSFPLSFPLLRSFSLSAWSISRIPFSFHCLLIPRQIRPCSLSLSRFPFLTLFYFLSPFRPVYVSFFLSHAPSSALNPSHSLSVLSSFSFSASSFSLYVFLTFSSLAV